jgi:DNA mismatch repair ATPase MutL
VYFRLQGKKGKEQLSEIDHFIRGIAIANPSVRFMLRHNRQLLWQHASSKQLKDSIASVYGNIGDMTSITYFSDNTRFAVGHSQPKPSICTHYIIYVCSLKPTGQN